MISYYLVHMGCNHRKAGAEVEGMISYLFWAVDAMVIFQVISNKDIMVDLLNFHGWHLEQTKI